VTAVDRFQMLLQRCEFETTSSSSDPGARAVFRAPATTFRDCAVRYTADHCGVSWFVALRPFPAAARE
jgi:hypothetical protein